LLRANRSTAEQRVEGTTGGLKLALSTRHF
jgi:hypothetical protein